LSELQVSDEGAEAKQTNLFNLSQLLASGVKEKRVNV
jgi:hypothetical protein